MNPRRIEIIPVLHVETFEQTISNVCTCADAGVSKIMLISHQQNTDLVLGLVAQIKETYGLWVGVNLLGKSADEDIATIIKYSVADGIWCDGIPSPEFV